MEKDNVSAMLKERAALKIALIGVGNAGNQLLNEAAKHDIKVFAINSSQKDLDNSIVDGNINSFIIGDDARGAAKMRDLAKARFEANGEQLFKEVPVFTDLISNSDVIIVAGATAGGTGSGVSPSLIGLLQRLYPNKIYIFFGVLPRTTDSAKAQGNSVSCLTEIDQLKIPYVLADLDYFNGVSNDEAYAQTQQYFIDCINIIRGKYLHESSYGMIDENDMRVVISEPGYMSMYHLPSISQASLDKQSIQSMIVDKIKNSYAAPIQRDRVIREMAVIINTPEEASDAAKAGDYSEITDYVGRPLAIYENYAITDSATSQIIVVLSGQTSPFTRITQMADIYKEWEANYNKHKDHSIGDLIKGTSANIDNIPDFLKSNKPTQDVNQDDILNSFFNH